jgi:hypothetical protein
MKQKKIRTPQNPVELLRSRNLESRNLDKNAKMPQNPITKLEINAGALGKMLYNSLGRKRKVLTATLLSTLLIIALGGVLLVKLGTAPYIPPIELEIIVTSPQNNTTYNVNSLPFIFSGSYLPYVTMNYSDVKCFVDGELVGQFDDISAVEVTNLTNLSDGNHTVRVTAFILGRVDVTHFNAQYGEGATIRLIWQLYNGSVIDTGDITFTVDVPEPFPTTLVLASVITVTVVSISLLVYFRKRKH